MKVRTLFGRQAWLMYEVCIQKPLRTAEDVASRSSERIGAEKQSRRRMCSMRNLGYVRQIERMVSTYVGMG